MLCDNCIHDKVLSKNMNMKTSYCKIDAFPIPTKYNSGGFVNFTNFECYQYIPKPKFKNRITNA